MKKSRLIKGIAVSMAMVMAFSVAGCQLGKNKVAGGANDPNAAKEHVYRETESFDFPYDSIDQYCLAGDYLYVESTLYESYCDDYSEDDFTQEDFENAIDSTINVDDEATTDEKAPDDLGEQDVNVDTAETDTAETDDEVTEEEVECPPEVGNECRFAIINWKTGERKEFSIQLPSYDSYLNNIVADLDGYLYMFISTNFESTDSNGEYVWETKMDMCKYDQTGKLLWTQDYKPEHKEDGYISVRNAYCLNNGNILICGDSLFRTFSPQGDLLKEITVVDQATEMYIDRIIIDKNDNAYITTYGEQGTDMYQVDLETGKLSEKMAAPSDAFGYYYSKGFTYDVEATGSNAVFGLNMNDVEHAQEIWNFLDSDVNCDDYNNFFHVSEERFIGVANGQNKIVAFDKVDPKDIKDQKILTLGGIYVDYDIKQMAMDFNKKNAEYRIRVIDYRQDDYADAVSAMNNDIAAGNTPDIILLSNEMPLQSYAKKGVFADLYKFMDNDPDISKENILPNVLQLCEYDGKMYQMFPSFSVQTMAVKSSALNGNAFDIDMVTKWEEEHNAKAFDETIQTDLLNSFMQYNYDEFLDPATGKCNFDTPEFVKVLKYAKTYPAEYDYSEEYTYDWVSNATMYREDRALIQYAYLNDFRSFNYQEKGTFGENITLVGFPHSEGTGACMNVYTRLAISNKSDYKDIAWQFVRELLLPEKQEDRSYEFPVTISAMQKKMESDQKRPFYEYDDGTIEEYDETYWIGEEEITLEPISQDRAQYVLDYIQTIDKDYYYNDGIMNIINEEAAPFFADQKTAEEVATIIQSRIQIYVNENL